jgi:hypothetical protein
VDSERRWRRQAFVFEELDQLGDFNIFARPLLVGTFSYRGGVRVIGQNTHFDPELDR